MESEAMEAQANEYLRRKEWPRAAELYNQILMNKNLNVSQLVSCLLARSECFREMGQNEAVVCDTRRVIKLLADKSEEPKNRARKILIHALFNLQRFAEAEIATREWLADNDGPNQNIEAVKLLEKLHAAFIRNGHSAILNTEANIINNDMKCLDPFKVSCFYCGLSFPDKLQLRGHCQTEAHQRVIMSDEGRDWRWRAPPRGLNTDTYSICESWNETGTCRYGNQCIEAHGEQELTEWKERFEYRKMKLQRAYEKELYGKSYTEELLEKWIESPSPEQIIIDKLDYIKDTCSSPLVTTVSSKNSEYDWAFTFTTDRQLCAVALLQDTHRNHFEIKEISVQKQHQDFHKKDIVVTNRQEWVLKVPSPNNIHTNTSSSSSNELLSYKILIKFRTEIYGTFRQTAVFDFGSVPVLSRHLCVDVIPDSEVDKVNEIRKEVGLSIGERWTLNNTNIVLFKGSKGTTSGIFESAWEKKLLEMYPSPQTDNFELSHATITEKRLTKTNYKPRMHELLYIEEMARYELVAQYNITTKLRIAHSYLLSPSGMASSTAKYSSSSELFALLYLGKDLSEDTSEGRLILNSCVSVFLSAASAANKLKADNENVIKPTVYEAIIEDKGKNMVYLRLSAQTVGDLKLQPDTEFLAQVQFQLNRLPFCEWHYVIDKIADYKILFPDTYVEPTIPWSPQRQWCDKVDSRLNIKQREAIVAITTPIYLPLPPILIIGPFGTGKTFTLAQAILQLSKNSENRILICTHSNSAADLYIKDYLHPHIEAGNKDCWPLRIYYQKRWVATVNSVVQKYCLIDNNGGVKSFRMPTLNDITNVRVVVMTVSISNHLSSLNLPKGFFTHIFIDEAAQTMECEAITPLTLATEKTRIVLAGDHMQLSPEIFSQFAKDRHLHISLLERLYDHYPNNFPCKILLSENYRAHEAIINFTSEAFYDQRLICRGKQPQHANFYPLTFFTTRGEDIQDTNSTAFYNNSEVYEIVERVHELMKKWPVSWGKLDHQSIGVMCPYSDQVFRIRSELRKRRLSNVSVERVFNVQGKQFRAIFISTVRTRRTCTGDKVNGSSCDLDFGFLSNSKLLNTAITRAQSLVAVVGDPVALCSVGRCCKLWEKFIMTCHEHKSLFGITWSSLRSQLDGVELKKTYSLNPLAPEFIPRKFRMEAYIRNAQVINAFSPILPPPLYHQYPGIIRPFIPHPHPHPHPPPPPITAVVPPPPQPAMDSFSGQFLYYANPAVPPPPIAAAISRFPGGPMPGLHAEFVREVDLPSPHLVQQQQHQQQNQQQHQDIVVGGQNYHSPVPGPFMGPKPLQQQPPPPILQPVVQQQQQQQIQQQQTAGDLQNYLMNQQPRFHHIRPQQQLKLDEVKIASSSTSTSTIQFLHNVHFPEPNKEVANCTLNDYISLLPQGMSLADMVTQTPLVHEQWSLYLLKNKGIEAAKKFEFLIHTATKSQNDSANSLIKPNPFNQGHPPMHTDIFNPMKSNVEIQHQQQIQQNGIHHHPQVQQQIQQQQQQPPIQQQVPLYKRQPTNNVCHPPEKRISVVENAPSDNREMLERHWQKQINAEFANLSITNGETVDEMLNKYQMTYAAVLRSSKPEQEPQQQQHPQQQLKTNKPPTQQLPFQQHPPINNVNVNINNMNCDSSSSSSNEPRLYKYFS